MKSNPLLASILATSLAIVVPPTHAHGAKHTPQAAEVDAEQTPWGIAGRPGQATRTITLVMADDMRFSPDSLTVQEGETVRFVVRNPGRMLHELIIGTPDELAKHAAMMAKFPDMEHDEPYMAHVDPADTGQILWHFNRPGTFEFACLIAGHYEAGMRGTLTVTPKKGAAK